MKEDQLTDKALERAEKTTEKHEEHAEHTVIGRITFDGRK